MTPGVPRMPAPTTESFEQSSRTRTARFRSPSSRANLAAAVAFDHEGHAGLIDRHLIDRDLRPSAMRRNISSSVSMRRAGDSMSPRMMRTHVTRAATT